MGKKIRFLAGLLSVWRLCLHPMSVWVFSRDSGLLPHPKGEIVKGTGVCSLPRLGGCASDTQKGSSTWPRAGNGELKQSSLTLVFIHLS